MKTKFDVGEEVFIKGTIEELCADKDGVRYRVKLDTDDKISTWFLPTLKEDDIERRVQQ